MITSRFSSGCQGRCKDLKELAKKYQPEGTKVADYDYGLIALDDPDFLAYAEYDVLTLRELTQKLFQMVRDQGYSGEYIWREMHVLTAIVCQMSLNGIGVDKEFAENRIAKQEERKVVLMQELVEKYDFPPKVSPRGLLQRVRRLLSRRWPTMGSRRRTPRVAPNPEERT